MSGTITTLRPFHEVLLDYIPKLSRHHLDVYGRLILVVKIPKAHIEAIQQAYQERATYVGWNAYDQDVIDKLEAEKKAAEAKVETVDVILESLNEGDECLWRGERYLIAHGPLGNIIPIGLTGKGRARRAPIKYNEVVQKIVSKDT